MFPRPSKVMAIANYARPLRMPLRLLSLSRVLKGGRIDDLGRLPRYAGTFLMGAAIIWAPIAGYLSTAQETYTSTMSLILPGSGSSASVNLDSIGQASSFANSPYAHNSVSPTVTYKRLIGADRIVASAAQTMEMARRDFGSPRVELVDQTGLIRVQVTGRSAENAQARGNALLAAFYAELDALRADELQARETSGASAITDYRASVAATREEIEHLQRETGLVSHTQYDAMVAETNSLRGRLHDLQTELAEDVEAVRALERTLGLNAGQAAATLKLHADSEFAALAKEIATKAAALADAEGRYGSRHPTVSGARAGHSAARAKAVTRAVALTGFSDSEVARLDLAPSGGRVTLLAKLVELDAERAGLAAEVAAMKDRVATDEATLARLLQPAARLEDLQRDFKVAEAVFASAIARSQTTKSDVYASYPLVQVLENPSLPERPSSPRKKLAIAAGAAAMVMLFVGLMLGWLRRPLIGRLLAAGPDA